MRNLLKIIVITLKMIKAMTYITSIVFIEIVKFLGFISPKDGE